jgi:putative methionine-R-sulfoxide reductase with GAF domain
MRVAQRLGVLDVARVTAAVQGMPARHGKAGRVADVVQPCGCFQEIGRRDAATHGEVCVLIRHGPGIEGVCGVDTAVTLSVNLFTAHIRALSTAQ